MADNDYKEGNSLSDNYAFTNPYAQGGAIRLKIDKIEKCEYLASFGYVVAVGGATVTVTPITGNTQPDLEYYRVEVSDGLNTQVVNQLDLANRTTPFVINTSTLDINREWTIFFYGADDYQTGDAGCSLDYKKELGVIAILGGSGDTIPTLAKWENVSFRLKLDSTDDAAFTLFPTGGVDIKDGGTFNVNDYTTNPLLVNGGSYKFKVEVKRLAQSPIASLPTPASNDAWTSFANTVTFPFPIPKEYTEALNALTIKTSVAGPFNGTMTVLVPGEGTKPSVSFTITTDVAV